MDYRTILVNLIVLTIAAIFILLWMRRDQQAKAAAAADGASKPGE
jgi:hypothetical protein